MEWKDCAVVLAAGAVIWGAGSFLTYPPYARLSALLFVVLALGIIALREGEVESKGKEGLEGETGKGPEPLAEEGGKEKSKKKKGKRKKTSKVKRKGK